MANVASPFGFVQVGTASGPVNYASESNPPWRIAAGNTGKIFFGDLVTLTSASDTGYITASAASDTTIPHVGVFYGCKYYSTGQRKTVWNNFWPGADATGDVSAFVCTDPNALFMCQAGATAIDQTGLGKLVDLVVGTGNTTTGLSTSYLAAISTQTTTLPFKIVGLVTAPPGVNGTEE
jgi:hypothetical protein